MKRRLYAKLFGSYLVFALIVILFLSAFSQALTDLYLTENTAQNLYRESTRIASDLKSYFSTDAAELPDIQESLQIVGRYLSSEIWIIDSSGNILLHSEKPHVTMLAQASTPIQIKEFDISDFGNNYFQTSDFYGNFDEDTLTVFSTITNNYKVRGYVLIHMPMAEVLEQSNSIVNIVFFSTSIVFICSFILLFVFTIIVYRPIRKITDAAEKYARGDFSQQIAVTSNDEIGYLADTLNYMANTLDSMEEEQRNFISNISHDFRSPLTSIKGYIEAMIDGTIPIEMQEKYLNIILFETNRLNKLTQSILALNQFGFSGTALDITEFDINELIRTTTRTFEGVCSQKGLSFELLLTEQKLFVKGDMGKIQQVLYNLIDNATKFSFNNSTIIIDTNIRNEKVLISVKDSGIGIPRTSTKKIWDRFYKTDISRGKDKKGSGLGLAIVKEIIQAHNENINVISTEDVGTEFIFTLPLSESEKEV